MVQIGPEEGELSYIYIFACSEIHEDFTKPLQVDVYSQPDTPKLHRSLLSTSKGIARHASPAHPPTTAFPTAANISNNNKNRTCTSDAASHPISCCDGTTNLLSHFYAQECIGGETTALEWSRLNGNQVRYRVLCEKMHENIMN
jgi:hypothetical protein